MRSMRRQAAMLAAWTAGMGCGGATEGELVSLDVATAPLAEAASFTTDTGWEVELEVARIAIGPIYVYAPAQGDALAWLRGLASPGLARAHAGDDPLNGRKVRAEWTTQVVLDVLAEEGETLGAVDAEAGGVSVATVVLNPPGETNAKAMHGHHLWVRGTARRGSQRVRFQGGLDLPELGLTRRVEEIPVDDYLGAGQRLVLTVDPRRWFQGAHFDRLVPPDDQVNDESSGAVWQLDPGSQLYGAWRLGARAPESFRLRLEEVAP